MRKTVPIVLSTVLAASILGTPVVTSAQTQDVKAETAQNDSEQINLSNCSISFNNSLNYGNQYIKGRGQNQLTLKYTAALEKRLTRSSIPLCSLPIPTKAKEKKPARFPRLPVNTMFTQKLIKTPAQPELPDITVLEYLRKMISKA